MPESVDSKVRIAEEENSDRIVKMKRCFNFCGRYVSLI